jgi:hypothetical protein
MGIVIMLIGVIVFGLNAMAIQDEHRGSHTQKAFPASPQAFHRQYPFLSLAYKFLKYDAYDTTPPKYDMQASGSVLAEVLIIRWLIRGLAIIALGLALLCHPYGVARSKRIVLSIIHIICILAGPALVFLASKIDIM